MNISPTPRLLPRQVLSLLLALLMAFTLIPSASAAETDLLSASVETLPSEEDGAVQEDVFPDSTLQDNVAPDSPSQEDFPEDTLPDDSASDVPSQDETAEDIPSEPPLPDDVVQQEPVEDEVVEDASPEDSVIEAVPDDSEALLAAADTQPEIAETIHLALDYDDRYCFDEGYEIVQIQTKQVTSYQVSGGKKTSRLDSSVVKADRDSVTDIIAAGTGTAVVLLAQTEEADLARQVLEGTISDTETSVSLIQVNVTVSPARLTLFFLGGQSNMEGYGAYLKHTPKNSVLCPEGEVYSSYAPKDDSAARGVTSLIDYTGFTTSTVNKYIPSSLTDTKNLSGSQLIYPLYSLTAEGKGKSGPDSGLAYQWNKLTGDKVWVINAAAGSSAIASWANGGSCYNNAKTFFSKAVTVFNAEVSAGHYTEGERILYWLQGEADHKLSAGSYLTSFDSMRKGLTSVCGLDYIGIIIPRAYFGGLTESDVTMTGPRIAQYYMGNSTSYSNVYVVSNVNEQWVTDAGVSSYFRSVYPSGKFTYPLRSSTTIKSLPTTMKEVHDGAHYSQVAHNENGLDAARNMYHVIYGGSESISVSWRNLRNTAISSLAVAPKKSGVLVPVVYPLYRSKQVSISLSSSSFTYSAKSGTITAPKSGSTTVKAKANGKTLSSLSVSANANAAPILTSLTVTSTGLKLSWSSLSGASSYRVYRKQAGGSWSQIATTKSTQYTDTSVKNGKFYTYTVRALRGSTLTAYDTVGLSSCYLAPYKPTVTNTASGVQLSLPDPLDDFGYLVYIYRRTGSGSWTRIGAQRAYTPSWVDTTAVSGTTYDYTVRISYANTASPISSVRHTYLSTPDLVSAACQGSGIRVSWKKVTGASGYRIYRKTAGSGWTRITDLSGGSVTSYTDTNVKNNTDYTYTVKALKGSFSSYYSTTGISCHYLTPPTISSASNTSTGITLQWNAITGATGYQLYRKTGSGSWAKIATITDGSASYTDSSGLSSGTEYTYTVRAQNSKGLSHYLAGRSVTKLDIPELSSAVCSNGAVHVSWQKVAGASAYRVYRKTAGSGWTRIADLTGGSVTSYDDTNVKDNTTYTYTVKAIKGSSSSYYSTVGISCLYLAPPTISSLANAQDGITLHWNAVPNAVSYHIYRKSGSSSWIRIASVSGSSTSYTDTSDLASGTKYTYTLRVQCDSSTSSYLSGTSILYLGTPSLTSAVCQNGSIRVTWEKVAGASGYRIYRKAANASGWTRIADLSGGSVTSYDDTGVKNNTSYTYTVKAINGSSGSYYSTTGISRLYLTPPAISSISKTSSGIVLHWKPIEGATGYQIYRKTDTTSWVRVDTVSNVTSYTDSSSLTSGTKYTYTLRAIGTNSLSAYLSGSSVVR